jgi:hypothetical protein
VSVVRLGMFDVASIDTTAIALVEKARDQTFDKRIFQRGPTTRLQMRRRPPSAPIWAWGLTYGTRSHPRIWLNGKIGDRRQLYAATHEPGHAIDDALFNKADRQYIMDNFMHLNTPGLGWRQGHYDAKWCEQPREAFADGLARAMATATGTGVDFDAEDTDAVPVILRGFFRTFVWPTHYNALIEWVIKKL